MGDRPTALQRLRARPGSVLLPATGVLVVLFLIGLLVSRGVTNPLVNIWLELATQWVPVSVFWVVAARTRFARWDVILAAAAVTLSAIGDTYYSLSMDSHGVLAFPSPADAGYLLFYPLIVAALIVLFRGRLRGEGAALLEGAIACLGAAAVLTVLLAPVLRDAFSGPDAFGSAISLAYPVLDVLLIAALAGVLVGAGIDAGPRSRSLLLGLLVFAAADIAYALLEHSGGYVAGTPLDACWAIGLALMAWWVDGIDRPAVARANVRGRRFAQLLPAVAVAAGLGVLLLGTQVEVPVIGLVLAALTVTLAAVPVILRQAMLSRLLASQGEAVRQLKDLDRAKSDLLVSVEHDFRAPLTIIDGYLELLLDGDGGTLPDQASRMLRVVKDSSDRMRVLLADLHTMSPTETRPARGADLIDLERLTSRAVTALMPGAAQRGIRLRLGRRWANSMVEGDERQLERALAQVLDNALKLTPSGGTVMVSVEKSVSDGGTPESVVRVADASQPGTGSDLATSRGIIEAHGGSIEAESEPDAGTTVTIHLPVPGGAGPRPRRRPARQPEDSLAR